MTDKPQITQKDIDDLFRQDDYESNKNERVGSTEISPYRHRIHKPGPKPKPKEKKLKKDKDGKFIEPKSGTKGLSVKKIKQLATRVVDEVVKKARKAHNKIVKEAKQKASDDEKRYRKATLEKGAKIDKARQELEELERVKYSLIVDYSKTKKPEPEKKKPGPALKWTPQLIEEFKVYQKHEAEKRNQINADILTAGESLMPTTAQNESEKNRLNLIGFKNQKKLHEKYLEAKQDNEINKDALGKLWKQSQPEHEHEYEVKFFMSNIITAACKVCSKEINMSIYDWIKFKRSKNAIGDP